MDNRDTFRDMFRTELPDGASLITVRYVITIESDEDKEERYKARYVARVHLDIMKDYLVHEAKIFHCVTVRRILVVAKIKCFRIWIVNVKLAYLQSGKPLIRKIFIKNPEPEFELSPGECLELLKTIYDLADSGDEWHRTLDDHVQIDLKMISTLIDPSLYCNFEDGQLVILNRIYIDEFL